MRRKYIEIGTGREGNRSEAAPVEDSRPGRPTGLSVLPSRGVKSSRTGG